MKWEKYAKFHTNTNQFHCGLKLLNLTHYQLTLNFGHGHSGSGAYTRNIGRQAVKHD